MQYLPSFNFSHQIWLVLIQCKQITKFRFHNGRTTTVEHTLVFLEVSLAGTCRDCMKSMKLIGKLIWKCLKASGKVNPGQNIFDFWQSPTKTVAQTPFPRFQCWLFKFRSARCTRQPSEPIQTVVILSKHWIEGMGEERGCKHIFIRKKGLCQNILWLVLAISGMNYLVQFSLPSVYLWSHLYF